MEKLTDWAGLWRELVEINDRRKEKAGGEKDYWNTRVRQFDEGVRQRWSQPDSSREFFIQQLTADVTLLDIGAGTGSWSMLASKYARTVTAVEMSPAMTEVMRANLDENGIENVEIVDGVWPEIDVAPHDFSLCSHGMYGALDLPAFINCMVEATRRMCMLVIRVPFRDGVMGEAALRVFGHPHDSPNFVIAYNILLEMGIHANVIMEAAGLWKPWRHHSMEEALLEMKGRLGLEDDQYYDGYLMDLLKRRLSYQDGCYMWPAGVRSALVYWKVG